MLLCTFDIDPDVSPGVLRLAVQGYGQVGRHSLVQVPEPEHATLPAVDRDLGEGGGVRQFQLLGTGVHLLRHGDHDVHNVDLDSHAGPHQTLTELTPAFDGEGVVLVGQVEFLPRFNFIITKLGNVCFCEVDKGKKK